MTPRTSPSGVKTRKPKRRRSSTKKGPRRLRVGDVIRSSSFANRETQDSGVPNEPWKVSDGKFFDGSDTLRDWAHRKFVVIRVAYEGGGTGMRPHDIYPDGWHIDARLLNRDGTYDPKAPSIEFYQTGCFTNLVKKFTTVGRMQMVFVPIEEDKKRRKPKMRVTVIDADGVHITMDDVRTMFVENEPGTIELAAAVKDGKLVAGGTREDIAKVLNGAVGVNLT